MARAQLICGLKTLRTHGMKPQALHAVFQRTAKLTNAAPLTTDWRHLPSERSNLNSAFSHMSPTHVTITFWCKVAPLPSALTYLSLVTE